MSQEYEVIEEAVLDAEELLKNVTNLRDLLRIEFISDADNILLLRKGLELVVQELGNLNSKIGGLR